MHAKKLAVAALFLSNWATADCAFPDGVFSAQPENVMKSLKPAHWDLTGGAQSVRESCENEARDANRKFSVTEGSCLLIGAANGPYGYLSIEWEGGKTTTIGLEYAEKKMMDERAAIKFFSAAVGKPPVVTDEASAGPGRASNSWETPECRIQLETGLRGKKRVALLLYIHAPQPPEPKPEAKPLPPLKPHEIVTQEDPNAKEPRFTGKGKGAKLVIPPAMQRALKAHRPDFRVDRLYNNDLEFLPHFTHEGNRLPVAVIADFDGDRKTDLAVRTHDSVCVVLSDPKGYRVIELSGLVGGLAYVAPGKVPSPYEGKNIVLKHAAIQVLNYEKSSAIYYYDKGSFKEFYTSD